eukprot:scaffold2661_cov120-Isochrysis_galbana.AAC.10
MPKRSAVGGSAACSRKIADGPSPTPSPFNNAAQQASISTRCHPQAASLSQEWQVTWSRPCTRLKEVKRASGRPVRRACGRLVIPLGVQGDGP